MVLQLPFDITNYYYDNGKCNEYGYCDSEHIRCVYNNCCNAVECVLGNYHFEFPFTKNYQELGIDLSAERNNNGNVNSNISSNTFSNTNEKNSKSNNKPTQNVKINKSSNIKIKTDNDKNINQKTNPNNNTINQNPRPYIDEKRNENNSNKNDSNNQNLVIDNVNNVKNSSVDNNINQKTIEEKNQKSSVISLPLISIIIIVIIGTVLSVSILKKRKNSKSKKENINVKSEVNNYTNPNNTDSNDSLIKITSIHNISDSKDPFESSEEYFNTISRIRYTDQTLSFNSNNKPMSYFPLFMSPTLTSTESFISNNSIANLTISQPIIANQQLENKVNVQNEPSSQSVEVTQISITETEPQLETSELIIKSLD